MFDRSSVALKYLLFALIATAANIGAQDLAIRAYDGPYSIPLAVVWGTGVGLSMAGRARKAPKSKGPKHRKAGGE